MQNNLDSSAETYQKQSKYYWDNTIILNKYPKIILKKANPNWNVLDLGLGHGITANIFSEFFKKYTILEGSPKIIKNYKEEFPQSKAHIIETYFENYNTDEKFDLIIMGFILEHVDNPLLILNKYKELLTPNGKIYASVPNAEAMNRRLGLYAGYLDKLDRLSSDDYDLGHRRYYTIHTFTEECKQAGLLCKNFTGLYLKPLTSMQLASLKLDMKVFDALTTLGESYPELSLGFLTELEKI